MLISVNISQNPIPGIISTQPLAHPVQNAIRVTQLHDIWQPGVADHNTDDSRCLCFSNSDRHPSHYITRRSILWYLSLRIISTSDLSGSLTYLGCTALSLHMPALRAVSPEGRQGAPIPGFPQLFSHHPRQLIMSGLTALWAIRLGAQS